MSLDVYLTATVPTEVYAGNITHNLTEMADEAGLYLALWRPDEIGIKRAKSLIPLLQEGLHRLRSKPKFYKKFDSPNKWGTYEGLVKFVQNYLAACIEYPEAGIKVSR